MTSTDLGPGLRRRTSPRNLAAYTLLPLAIVGFALGASWTLTTWVLETWWCPLINGPED